MNDHNERTSLRLLVRVKGVNKLEIHVRLCNDAPTAIATRNISS